VTKFDTYLGDSGPAALVLREELLPVEGDGGVFFPPTYAAGDGFLGGYNIDGPADGENVCLVDSVGSQANRIEPMFGRAPYAQLVPQVTIRAGDRVINLLEAGHRAGDAIVRSSELQEELQLGFKALLKNDAQPLAKIAPTSLVFGVWDSRDTQAKLPRIVSSVIRAHNVQRLTRSATYVPATQYVASELLEDPQDNKQKEAYSQRGFLHALASGTHGGVIAKGKIVRTVTLSLAALRLLSAGGDVAKAAVMRRYILGLALTAFTGPASTYLRSGCNLVLKGEGAREVKEVHPSGRRSDFSLSHDEAVVFAKAAATAFGVGTDRSVEFDKERAKNDIAGDGEAKSKRAKSKKAK
jgi:CRISPR-associated protein Csb1